MGQPDLRVALATHRHAEVVNLLEVHDGLDVAHLAGPGLLEAVQVIDARS